MMHYKNGSGSNPSLNCLKSVKNLKLRPTSPHLKSIKNAFLASQRRHCISFSAKVKKQKVVTILNFCDQNSSRNFY